MISGSKAQYKGDTRSHGVEDPSVYVALKVHDGPLQVHRQTLVASFHQRLVKYPLLYHRHPQARPREAFVKPCLGFVLG